MFTEICVSTPLEISELAMKASSNVEKTMLDSQLYSGWLILGKVLVTSSQSTFREQKDRHRGRSFKSVAFYAFYFEVSSLAFLNVDANFFNVSLIPKQIDQSPSSGM